MRRSTLAICALLAVTTAGCDKIKGFLNKKPAAPTTPTATHPGPADTSKAPGAPIRHPGPAAAPAPVVQHPKPPASLAAARPTHDVDYESPDTGTIAAGMSERDVETLWGPPYSRGQQGGGRRAPLAGACVQRAVDVPGGHDSPHAAARRYADREARFGSLEGA